MSIPFLSPPSLGSDADLQVLAASHPLAHTYLVKHEDFIDLAPQVTQDGIDVHRGILDGRAYDLDFVLVLKHQVHKHNGHWTELRQITPKLFVINLPSREMLSLASVLGCGSFLPASPHPHTRNDHWVGPGLLRFSGEAVKLSEGARPRVVEPAPSGANGNGFTSNTPRKGNSRTC